MGTSLIREAQMAVTSAPVAEEPGIATVVVTGLVLVFSILVLLMFIIILQGKIFTAIENRKKGVKPQAPKAAAAPAAPAAKAAAPAPVVEKGIPAEVVAVIAAAIAAMGNGRYALRSLTRKKTGRSAWNVAGVNSNTEPF